MILDDAQIEANMRELIDSSWPPAAREKVLRTGVGKIELDVFFDSMSVIRDQKIADRDAKKLARKLLEEAANPPNPEPLIP